MKFAPQKTGVTGTSPTTALAEYQLLKFSFRAWQKYHIFSLLSLGWLFEGILINISPKKNASVRVFTLTILWLSAILKRVVQAPAR